MHASADIRIWIPQILTLKIWNRYPVENVHEVIPY